MTKLGGGFKAEYTVNASIHEVLARFTDLAAICAATAAAESTECVDAHTIHFLLRDMSYGPVRFQGDYTVKYTRTDPHGVDWYTCRGNLDNTGHIRVTSREALTHIAFEQVIAFDLTVPRLLVRTIQPVLDKMIEPSIQRYVEAMLKGL